MDIYLKKSKQNSAQSKTNFEKSFKVLFSQGENNLSDSCFNLYNNHQNNTPSILGDDNSQEENDKSNGTSPEIPEDTQSEQNINMFPGLPSSNNALEFNDNNNNSNSPYNPYNANSQRPTQSNTNGLPNKEDDNFIQNKRGRNRSENSIRKEHTKFSTDNLKNKITNSVLKFTREYINRTIQLNNKIYSKYEGKILIINKIDRNIVSMDFYKEYYQKTIREIFSANISGRYKCPIDQNKNLINSLLTDKNEETKQINEKLLNLKLIDFLKKFNGNPDCKDLEGFPTFDEIKYKISKDEIYLNALTNYLTIFVKTLDKQ